MSGVFKSRISDETLELIANNLGFYRPLLDSVEKHEAPVGLMFREKGARTETRKLANGDLEVLFTLPIDDNYDREDGRLWVVDRFVFDHKDSTLSTFQHKREIKFNQLGQNHLYWRHWKEVFEKEGQVKPEVAADFVNKVAHTYARPLMKNHLEAMGEAMAKEREAGEDGGKNGFLAPLHRLIWKHTGLLIRFQDPRNHYTLVERDGSYDLIFSYVVRDENPNTKGFIWVRDRFSFFQMNEPVGFSRSFTVSHETPAGEKAYWEAKRKALYETDDRTLKAGLQATMEGAAQFFKTMRPHVKSRLPNFDALREQEGTPEPEGGYRELSLAEFEKTIRDGMEQREARSLADYEPQLNMALALQRSYYAKLQEGLGKDIPFNWIEPSVNIDVETSGEETRLKFYYRLGDPNLDGADRGHLLFTETFVFQGKQLKKIDRALQSFGKDPEGILAQAYSRLNAALVGEQFPEVNSPETQQWVQAVLPLVAPQLSGIPGRVPILDSPDVNLEEEKADHLKALREIQEKITPVLHHSTVDPKVRVRLIRALEALQYGDVQTAFQDIQSIIQDLQAQGTQKAGSQRQQDFATMGNIILSFVFGDAEQSLVMSKRLNSPKLRQIFHDALAPIKRRDLNLEGLEILFQVARNQIQLEDKESDSWLGGKNFDGQDMEKVAAGLLAKARLHAKTHSLTSPFAVLQGLEDLNASEQALRSKMLADPILNALNNIATDNDTPTQGRDYFRVAEGTLREAKLLGAAQWLTQYVAIHKLPKTPSLEGLEVLSAFSLDRLIRDTTNAQLGQVSEKEQWLQLLSDPTALANLRPDQQKNFQEKLLTEYGPYIQEAQRKLIEEDPYFAALALTLASGTSLMEKAKAVAEKNPNLGFRALLQNTPDINPSETIVRDLILSDPRFTKLLDANTQASVKDRHQAYGKIFTELSQDPELGGLALGMIQSLGSEDQGGQFPQERAQEGLLIMGVFLLGNAENQMMSLTMTALGDKIQRDVMAEKQDQMSKLQRELGPKKEAHAKLMERARYVATLHPTETPLQILARIKDEDLDGEYAALEASMPDPDVDQQSTLAYAKQVVEEMKSLKARILQDEFSKNLSEILLEENPIKRRDRYGKFFGEIQKQAGALQSLIMMVQEPDPDKRKAMVDGIIQEGEFSQALQARIKIAAAETDRQKLLGYIQEIGQSEEFGKAEYLESAVKLSQALETGKLLSVSQRDLIRFDSQLDEKQIEMALAQTPEDPLPKQVQKFLAYTQGEADVGTTMEYGAPAFLEEVSKPTTLVAMGLAGYAGPVAESLGLRLLARSGAAGKWFTWGTRAAAVTGAATEGWAFTTFHKVGESAFHSSRGQWDHYWGDVGTNALAFGGLRIGHSLVGQFTQKVLATGRLGKWAGGPAKVGSAGATVTPLGRPQVTAPLANGTVPQLTKGGRFVSGMLHHPVAFGAMFGSGYVARWTGMAPDTKMDWKEHASHTLVMYLQSLAMFNMVNRATGGRFQRDIGMLRLNNQRIADLGKLHRARPKSTQPELIDRNLLRFEDPEMQTEVVKVHLKKVLNLSDVENIEVKVEGGKIKIKDTRVETSGEGVPSMEVKGESETVQINPSKTGPIELRIDGEVMTEDGWITPPVGGEAVPKGQWVEITPGQRLYTSEGREWFTDNIPGMTPFEQWSFLEPLADIPREQQMSLANLIGKAKNLRELGPNLMKAGEGGPELNMQLQLVLSGKLPLERIPKQFRFRSTVLELMNREVTELQKRDYSSKRYKLKDGIEDGSYAELQRDYITGRLAESLAEQISQATTLKELEEVLEKSPFGQIDGVPMENIIAAVTKGESTVAAAGIGQKVRDILEAQEPSSLSDKDSYYFVKLVTKHFAKSEVKNFAEAQRHLRNELDQLTPNAKIKLLKGYLKGMRQKDMQLILDVYLGKTGVREMNSYSQGFEIATLLGKAGMPEAVCLESIPGSQGAPSWFLVRKTNLMGEVRVISRAVNKDKPAEAVDVLFTPQEVGDAFRGKTLKGNDSGSVVLFHPLGAAELSFKVEEGKVVEAKVRYAFSLSSRNNRPDVQAAAKALRNMQVGETALKVEFVPKYKDLVSSLEAKPGLPNWREALSSYMVQLPIRPRWLKLPEIAPLARFRRTPSEKGKTEEVAADEVKPEGPAEVAADEAKPEGPATEKEPTEAKPEAPAEEAKPKEPGEEVKLEEPAEETTPQSEVEPDTKKEPVLERQSGEEPGLEQLGEEDILEIKEELQPQAPARESKPDLVDPNIKRIKNETMARFQEALREAIQKRDEEGKPFQDGELIEFNLNAGEASGQQKYEMVEVMVTLRFDGQYEQFKLQGQSAQDLRNALEYVDSAEVKAFYQGLLAYENIGLSLSLIRGGI